MLRGYERSKFASTKRLPATNECRLGPDLTTCTMSFSSAADGYAILLKRRSFETTDIIQRLLPANGCNGPHACLSGPAVMIDFAGTALDFEAVQDLLLYCDHQASVYDLRTSV